MAPPAFSIVIVAYGARAATERCLESLDRCFGGQLGAGVELVLVDNASPDDTLELFDAWSSRATVVRLPVNRNFAGGCNAGAAAASAEVLVFLNNDTDVEPGALEALARQAGEGDVGAAGLRLLYPDGTLQHAGVAMIRVPSGHVLPHHIFHHQDGDLPAARASYDLDAVTAACLAIRREVFLEIGGYDEGYVNGWEDVDLCLRVRMSERRVVYRGDLWLWHDEGRSRGQVRGFDANAHRFFQRWAAVLDSDEELVARVFGARLPTQPAPEPPEAAPVLVTGPITGISSDAAEARGLLSACAAAGLTPAARDITFEMVRAGLAEAEDRELRRATARQPHPGALRVCVAPAGPAVTGATLRLAVLPAEPLPDGVSIWAASPLLRDQLIARGADPERTAWLAPCVPVGPPGPGGGGLLCALPGHDLNASASALEAVASLGAERVRIVPSVASSPLLALIAARLPRAEVLAPCQSDAGFRELAATADIVLCADADDRFERRSLVAAGAGALPVIKTGGPASAVLGALAPATAAFSAEALRGALGRAVAEAGKRHVLAQAVSERCSPAACAARLTSLLARAGSPAVLAVPA